MEEDLSRLEKYLDLVEQKVHKESQLSRVEIDKLFELSGKCSTYIERIYRILQTPQPRDFVMTQRVASGIFGLIPCIISDLARQSSFIKIRIPDIGQDNRALGTLLLQDGGYTILAYKDGVYGLESADQLRLLDEKGIEYERIP